ncbi:TolC family protein [Paraflavitalea speifideaquila]|uniref:TolC family protein n=1 Tax=Paraflavitalea speifideaquila TaxID=3076558 RepID=UPI0028E6F8BF|nr:TolC family protein [Paraflavitalea speifideiaquila]
MNRSYFLFRHCMVVVVVFLTGVASNAQDTLRITLQDAEQLFIQNNLVLLAAKYDVHIAQAQLIQAKLYNNPTLSVSGNLYNPNLKNLLTSPIKPVNM